MAKKTRKVYTVSLRCKKVILWDTTLRPLSVQLRAYDSESLGYESLFNKFKNTDTVAFTTKSGVKYIVQCLTRD